MNENRTVKFSHRKLDSLSAPPLDWPSSNIEYTDAAESGLRVAVYKSGRMSFRFRGTFNGRKIFITIGPYPAVSVERARERVREFKAMLAEGINPKERQAQTLEMTFRVFCEEYYLPFARQERRSISDIENRIKKRLLQVFGGRPLTQITKAEIAKFHLKLRDEISATTANRYLSLLSSIFQKALELELVSKNPVRGVKKFKEAMGRDRVLSNDELGRFLKALRERLDEPAVRAVFLLISLGLRKLEVLSLSWQHIDLGARQIYLPHTKSGRPRYVVINSQAQRLLTKMQSERCAESDWLFPSDSKIGHLMEVRKTFASLLKKAGIEGVRLHDLRRTHASLLINSGVSIYEVRDILGHQDVRTTQIYAHLGTSVLANASEKAAAKIEEALAHD